MRKKKKKKKKKKKRMKKKMMKKKSCQNEYHLYCVILWPTSSVCFQNMPPLWDAGGPPAQKKKYARYMIFVREYIPLAFPILWPRTLRCLI